VSRLTVSINDHGVNSRSKTFLVTFTRTIYNVENNLQGRKRRVVIRG